MILLLQKWQQQYIFDKIKQYAIESLHNILLAIVTGSIFQVALFYELLSLK